jgi:hypothetical protein
MKALLAGLVVLLAACGSSSSEIDSVVAGAAGTTGQAGASFGGTNQGGTPSGGAGHGGSSAEAGHAGASDNCVEIRIGRNLPIGFDGAWTPALEQDESFFFDETSLGVMFSASSPTADLPAFIALFDLQTAQPLSIQPLLKSLWDNIAQEDWPTFGSAWGPDHTFALGAATGLYLGLVPPPQFTFHKLPAISYPGGPFAAAWDGQSFTLHYSLDAQGQQCPLALARVAPDGSVLLPISPFGASCTPVFDKLSHALTTDPVSGNTFIADISGSVLLNGHDRLGQPLWGGPLAFSDVKSVVNPAISADAEGAFFLVDPPILHPQGPAIPEDAPRVFRVDLAGHVTPVGSLPLPAGEYSMGVSAIASVSASEGMVVVNTNLRTYVIDIVSGQLGPPRAILDTGITVAEQTALEEANSEALQGKLILGSWHAYIRDGRRWVVMEDNTGPPTIRVLRVDDPACVYPVLTAMP